jgi:hypothetical protein
MKYELGLQLKNMGFPQEKCSFGFYRYNMFEDANIFLKSKESMEEPENYIKIPNLLGNDDFELLCSIPTLSELINECNGRCEEISKIKHTGDIIWHAYSYSCEECGWKGMYIGKGKTPEEAVANLWLELNKKSTIEDLKK